MRALVAVLLVATVLALPATASTHPSCADATTSPAPAKLHFGSPTYVWRESNLEPGIQEQDCRRSDGTIIPADSRTQDFWPPCWNGGGFQVCLW